MMLPSNDCVECMKNKAKPELENLRNEIVASFAGLPHKMRGITLWASQAWRDLVLSRGWVCPSWRTEWGGTGWSPAEKFVWYQACHQAFDDYHEPPEIADVGPVLGRWGHGRAHAELIDIAALTTRWSLALFEDGFSGVDLGTEFTKGKLKGHKTHVRYVRRADRLLVVAKQDLDLVLLSVSIDAPGIAVYESPGLSGGDEFARVEFFDVAVSPDNVLGRLARDELTVLCHQVIGLELGRSGVLTRQLERLARAAGPDPEDTRLAALQISVQALAALEARVVSAQQAANEPPVPWSMLQARSLALQLEVGEALVDCFGYYALPFPDPVSLHNEGPIGPDVSDVASYAMLRATEQVNYANLAGDLYDIAAREWLIPADKGK